MCLRCLTLRSFNRQSYDGLSPRCPGAGAAAKTIPEIRLNYADGAHVAKMSTAVSSGPTRMASTPPGTINDQRIASQMPVGTSTTVVMNSDTTTDAMISAPSRGASESSDRR